MILSVPARVELPAARMAQTAPALSIDGTRPTSLGDLTLRMAEDHPAADRLKDPHHVTASSEPMCLAPFSTTTIVPSSR